jgi:hypothetical protein
VEHVWAGSQPNGAPVYGRSPGQAHQLKKERLRLSGTFESSKVKEQAKFKDLNRKSSLARC